MRRGDGAFLEWPVLVKPGPEKEGAGSGHIQESGKGVCRARRVPLELPLAVRTVVGLEHAPGEIAQLLEIRWQYPLAVGERSVQVLGSGCVSILAGQHADAGRAALRRCTERELDSQARAREPVEVRCANESVAVHAGVTPAQIVGHKDHDIGPRIGRRLGLEIGGKDRGGQCACDTGLHSPNPVKGDRKPISYREFRPAPNRDRPPILDRSGLVDKGGGGCRFCSPHSPA
jgi:hypothetical protein